MSAFTFSIKYSDESFSQGQKIKGLKDIQIKKELKLYPNAFTKTIWDDFSKVSENRINTQIPKVFL